MNGLLSLSRLACALVGDAAEIDEDLRVIVAALGPTVNTLASPVRPPQRAVRGDPTETHDEMSDTYLEGPAWDSLPDEILLLIFMDLSLVDTVSLQSCCRRFKRIARDNVLWRERAFMLEMKNVDPGNDGFYLWFCRRLAEMRQDHAAKVLNTRGRYASKVGLLINRDNATGVQCSHVKNHVKAHMYYYPLWARTSQMGNTRYLEAVLIGSEINLGARYNDASARGVTPRGFGRVLEWAHDACAEKHVPHLPLPRSMMSALYWPFMNLLTHPANAWLYRARQDSPAAAHDLLADRSIGMGGFPRPLSPMDEAAEFDNADDELMRVESSRQALHPVPPLEHVVPGSPLVADAAGIVFLMDRGLLVQATRGRGPMTVSSFTMSYEITPATETAWQTALNGGSSVRQIVSVLSPHVKAGVSDYYPYDLARDVLYVQALLEGCGWQPARGMLNAAS